MEEKGREGGRKGKKKEKEKRSKKEKKESELISWFGKKTDKCQIQLFGLRKLKLKILK